MMTQPPHQSSAADNGQHHALETARRRLERLLADDELRFCSETASQIEQILAGIDEPRVAESSSTPGIAPGDIKIFAVHDSQEDDPDLNLIGFSFDPEPGNGEPQHRHALLNPLDPGASLHLYCFATAEQATAFVEGLHLFRNDHCGQITRTFAPGLTAVLVEFFDSPASQLTINTDHLHPTRE